VATIPAVRLAREGAARRKNGTAISHADFLRSPEGSDFVTAGLSGG
jgi:hypothetical protein